MPRHFLMTKAICGVMSVVMMGLSIFSVAGSETSLGNNNVTIRDQNKHSEPKAIIKPVAVPLNKTAPLNPARQQITRIAGAKPNGGSAPDQAIERVGWADYAMLARIIHAEAGGEPLQGQVGVGAVILNRINSGKFPRTVTANVMKSGEFESVSNGYIWSTPTASDYQAARLALNGWDPTHGAIYFYNPAKTSSPWIWGRPIITQIGKHNFAA